MKTLKWILAGMVVGLLVAALRDWRRGGRPAPTLPTGGEEEGEQEPILGYDGMDQETLLDWLSDANLDTDTLERIIRYEEKNQRREPVLKSLKTIG